MSSSPTTRAGRGRKTARRRLAADARIRRFLEIAETLFLENGYAGTSLNDVIRLAGGSKATLSAAFGSKAGLFEAVIASGADAVASRLRTAAPDDAPALALRVIGELILDFYLAPRALVAYRGVISEGHREPAMARAFYRRGHAQVVAPLADRLRTWKRRGLLTLRDPRAEADRFTHVLRSGLYEQVLLGIRRCPTRRQVRAQVAAAVRTYLLGLSRRS